MQQPSAATEGAPLSSPPTANASTLLAVAGTAATGPTSRPCVTISGWRARFVGWLCCMLVQHTNSQQPRRSRNYCTATGMTSRQNIIRIQTGYWTPWVFWITMHLLNGHTIVSWPSALRQCIASYFLLLPATAVSCFTDATVRFMRWDIGTLPDPSACGCADRPKQLLTL
ncbi:hypothetical protein BD769DRAFT_1494617 [Suillus cothurnatus]|nr:hypothetical protein BD769DRAFT_1494617 [Suillus cothurnatus]